METYQHPAFLFILELKLCGGGLQVIQTPPDSDHPNPDHWTVQTPRQFRPPNSNPPNADSIGSELFRNVYVTQNTQYGSTRYI